jgi:hypothetical protein
VSRFEEEQMQFFDSAKVRRALGDGRLQVPKEVGQMKKAPAVDGRLSDERLLEFKPALVRQR